MTERTSDAVEWLTRAEAAELLRVVPRTLIRWERAGRITAYVTPSGHKRYRAAEVDALLQVAS